MYLNNYNKKIEKNALTIEESFNYWVEMLFEKCIRIFKWRGLPDNMPQKEIETRLIYDGFCGYVNDGYKGQMIASGSMYGVTQYYDEYTNFKYAVPTCKGGAPLIGKECVVINNTALRNSLFPLIRRYASLLAHAEISLKISLVNLRATDVFAVEDNSIAESVKAYYAKLYEGKPDIIIDDALVNAIKNIANVRQGNAVNDCLTARNEILRAFYNEIGVRYARDKKERLVSDEATGDAQMLLINIKDMLAQRKKASEEINRIFGRNTGVELSEEYEIIEEGATNDDRGINTDVNE